MRVLRCFLKIYSISAAKKTDIIKRTVIEYSLIIFESSLQATNTNRAMRTPICPFATVDSVASEDFIVGAKKADVVGSGFVFGFKGHHLK